MDNYFVKSVGTLCIETQWFLSAVGLIRPSN